VTTVRVLKANSDCRIMSVRRSRRSNMLQSHSERPNPPERNRSRSEHRSQPGHRNPRKMVAAVEVAVVSV
jgi:hypothetical protein